MLHDLTDRVRSLAQNSSVYLTQRMFPDNPTLESVTLFEKNYIYIWVGNLAASNYFKEPQSKSDIKLLNAVLFSLQCNTFRGHLAIEMHG